MTSNASIVLNFTFLHTRKEGNVPGIQTKSAILLICSKFACMKSHLVYSIVTQQQCNQTKHHMLFRCQNSLLSMKLFVFSSGDSTSQKIPLPTTSMSCLCNNDHYFLVFTKTVKSMLMKPRMRQLNTKQDFLYVQSR